MAGAPLKFPQSSKCTVGDPAFLCPAQRVLDLYNQANPKATRERICKAVKEWFEQQAKAEGWAGARFFKEYQSNYGAGCVLWIAPNTAPAAAQLTSASLV
jgi:hypothetical protein